MSPYAPRPGQPLFYVCAEAEGGLRDGKKGSEGLVLEYAELVEDLIKSG